MGFFGPVFFHVGVVHGVGHVQLRGTGDAVSTIDGPEAAAVSEMTQLDTFQSEGDAIALSVIGPCNSEGDSGKPSPFPSQSLYPQHRKLRKVIGHEFVHVLFLRGWVRA